MRPAKRIVHEIADSEQLAGWRIYVTNVAMEQLSTAQAVVYYRDQWQLEHGFGRFKRGQLPALPIYLANEDRIIGLMFLLTIALRCFTLIEFQVRRQLQAQQGEIAGLYAGNPKRKPLLSNFWRPSMALPSIIIAMALLKLHRSTTYNVASSH